MNRGTARIVGPGIPLASLTHGLRFALVRPGYGERRPAVRQGGRVRFLRMHQGRIMERISSCACGTPIEQVGVSEEWLGGLRYRARASFLEACAESAGVAYLAGECVRCAREALRR